MKNKLVSILAVSVFLFVIGLNDVKADDSSLENTNTQQVTLKIKTEESGEFNLQGIEGTVKDKIFVQDCSGNIEFLVLTTDSKIYTGMAENPYPNGEKYDENVQMKLVKNDNNDKISDLTYTLGGIGCGALVPGVKLESGKIEIVNFNSENNSYSLTDSSVEEAQSVTIDNKKYYFSVLKSWNEENPAIVKANIKEYLYAYDCGGYLYLVVLTDDLNLYVSKITTSENVKNAVIMYNIKNEYKGKIKGLTKYDVKDFAVNSKNMSNCMANLGVKFEDGKIYSLQTNGSNEYYLDTKVECIEEGTTRIKNPKTGNYTSYAAGLLFVLISGICLFALKNKKVLKK